MTLCSIRLPFLVAAVLGMTACAPSAPPPATPAEPAAAAPAAAPAAAAVAPTPDTGTTLTANEWQLESATDAAGQSIAAFFPGEQPLGLAFLDGRIGVTGSCNRMGAAYRLVDAGKMEVSPGLSTMMACPPPLAAADAAFARFLRGSLQVAVDGDAAAPRLRLSSADGSTLTFKGKPTPETRFGGPGQRAFLEVSPTPCTPPAGSVGPCLTVRDRFFDDKGIAGAPPGEWRTLQGGIEGYTPVAGEQQVVRVKRFEKAGAGGTPEVHYVLDLIVETRTIR
jgi:heat shock protein HslJ